MIAHAEQVRSDIEGSPCVVVLSTGAYLSEGLTTTQDYDEAKRFSSRFPARREGAMYEALHNVEYHLEPA